MIQSQKCSPSNEFILDLIRDIKDPEFPNTLEELGVLCEDWVRVEESTVTVQFKPTIPHCSLATMIGELFIQLFS